MKNHFDAATALLILVRYGDSASALRQLLEEFGSAEFILKAGKKAWRAAGISEKACIRILDPDLVRIERDLEWCDDPRHHIVDWQSPDYPSLLRRAENPPAVLFVLGNVDLLWHPQIAVVGSRHPSAGGKDNARQFSRAFAHAGWGVTSGLAEGIDTSAHRAVLDLEDMDLGRTIAVVATGPDVAYPKENRELMDVIAQSGAIVSEHPPGTPPLREHFPSRNRIIAGLSLGCLVVEAAERSGALITARLAGEMGREVFAVPGSIHNPMARGCHKLIRQGATLVEKPGQIVEALEVMALELADALRGRLHTAGSPCEQRKSNGVSRPYAPIWDAIGHDLVNLDQLAERTGLTTPELSSMLLIMELEGNITVSDGRYARNA
ncbi:MAG: DNA-processing protein DprA [Arenimonas sp.]